MRPQVTCPGRAKGRTECLGVFERPVGSCRKWCEACHPPRIKDQDPADVAAPPAAPAATPPPPAPRPPGAIEQATRADLAKAGRLDTWKGQIAVRLARQLDDESPSTSSVASLGAQLERTMDSALAGAKLAPDEVDAAADEIAKQRAALRSVG